MDTALVTLCHLHFSYWPINIKHLMRMYKDIRYQRRKTWCQCFSYNCLRWLETAIHKAVTTVRPGCEVKACRFHLGQSWWQKIQFFGLSRQYGKKDSEVSPFLKTIFRLSLLPPAEVSDWFTLEFISNLPNDNWVEEFCDYLLENYTDADSTFPPPVWSECSTSAMRTINS